METFVKSLSKFDLECLHKVILWEKAMRHYQMKNNIIKQCVTNTQYIYDCINRNFPNLKPKAEAVIVAIEHKEKKALEFVTHVVVLLKDFYIVDASYETKHQQPTYFFSIKEMLDAVLRNNTLDKPLLKYLIEHYIKLNKLAREINNGEFLICDKEFYNKQADYVEKSCKDV